MQTTTISDAVRYIGADDTTIDLFESQYEVPNGVSYNSYVILDEKIAVMDTVDARKTDEWLSNLKAALDGRNAATAVDAVNDMTAGANVPPEVQTQIQSVMAAVEQLANVAGLATQNDMNGNVDANVPPAEGMGVVDENSTMFERAMFRRSTLLEEINIPQAKKIASGVSKYSGKTWKPAAIKYSKTGSLISETHPV